MSSPITQSNVGIDVSLSTKGTATTTHERKPRKSVAFSEGTIVVDSNGDVTTEMNGIEDKSTAESHTAGGCIPEDFLGFSANSFQLPLKQRSQRTRKQTN